MSAIEKARIQDKWGVVHPASRTLQNFKSRKVSGTRMDVRCSCTDLSASPLIKTYCGACSRLCRDLGRQSGMERRKAPGDAEEVTCRCHDFWNWSPIKSRRTRTAMVRWRTHMLECSSRTKSAWNTPNQCDWRLTWITRSTPTLHVASLSSVLSRVQTRENFLLRNLTNLFCLPTATSQLQALPTLRTTSCC